MKTKTTIANTILSLLCFLYTTIIYGQNAPENSVYIAGDAIINPTFEASLHEIMWNPEVLTRSLPSSVDNSSLMKGYMPPIFDQGYSSSCVQCAEIGYVYTYEVNRYKDVSAGSHWHNGIEADMQNLYHPFFTYNFLNEGNGKKGTKYGSGFHIVAENGCPSLIDYYHPNLNNLPYNPDQDQFPFRYWMSGDDKYISATENYIDFSGIEGIFRISWGNNYGSLDRLKRWLFSHNTTNGVGGLAIISVYMDYNDNTHYTIGTIPNGSPHQGEYIITSWASSGGHVLTIVGYDDNIWVSNNHVQPNSDTPLANCERGAFKVANSWGPDWKNNGYIWVPYKLLAGGQLQEDYRAYTCIANESEEKKVFLSATVAHPSRKHMKIVVGKAANVSTNVPEDTNSFMVFNKQGGFFPMNGNANNPAPIDLAINFSKKFSPTECGKYFFQVVDNFSGQYSNNSAYISSLQLHDYRWDEYFVLESIQPLETIQNHNTTTLSIDYDLIFPFEIKQNYICASDKVARRQVTVYQSSTFSINDGVSLDMYGTEAHDCQLVVEPNSTMIIGDNAVITAKRGDCEIVVNGNIQIGRNVTFKAEEGATLNIKINGQRDFTLSDCLFANASLSLNASVRGLAFPRPIPSSATISRCRFEASAGLCNHALRIDGYSYVAIDNNIVNGLDEANSRHYEYGFLFHNCGEGGLGSLLLRNTIKGCTETGLTLYASTANVKQNEVTQCRIGVRLLNGSTVSEFTGNCGAISPSLTQHIHDNDECEVSVYRDCIPQTFRYNRITNSGNGWLFEYENNVEDGKGECFRIDLEHNNWGSLTNTQIESRFNYVTNTNNSVSFDYLPKWSLGACPGSGNEMAIRKSREADSLLNIGLFSAAKANYKEIVTLYPNTVSAANALKKLLIAENLSEENYGELQQFYQNETAIQDNEILAALAGTFANKCDELQEHYDEAIAWYETIIEDEETPYNDSLFATIDLGNLYLKMEAGGIKGTKGTLTQFVPKSAEAFAKQTDEALKKLKSVPRRTNPSRELPNQYWTDLVTEQPEGYVVDANGNVHLRSAEALAWLCSVTNGLNGQEADDFNGKKVTLEANVDMSEAIWASLSGENSAPSFMGTFEGNGHIIDGLQLTRSIGFKTGFFGNITEATLSNIVIRRGYFEGYGFDIGFLASRTTKSFIDRCFVECEMHGGGEMVPFIFTNEGSTIANSMVYCPLLKSVETNAISGIFVAYNTLRYGETDLPRIQNCASIVEKMDWSKYCGIAGEYNYGLIENSYAYIGEFLDFGGYGGGPAPRNGITETNMETGEIINCYYNRVRNHVGSPYYIEMDDLPADENFGLIHDSHPYSEEGRGCWKLIQPVIFELENGTISTDDLLEALYLKSQQMTGHHFMTWCENGIGFNCQGLPVFCEIDITNNGEDSSFNGNIHIYPNPTKGEVTVTSKGLSHIRIMNAYGQTVDALNVDDDHVQIDLSKMPKGVYMMHIEANGGQTIRKIVLQ